MANRVNITITTDLSPGTLSSIFSQEEQNADASISKIINFFLGLNAGTSSAAVTTSINEGGATEATETITLNGASSGDELLINGVSLEAGVDWFVGPSDEAAAINLAEAINTSVNPLIAGIIIAVAVGDTVVLHAASKGALGNSVTTSGTGGVEVPDPRLTGGTNSSISTTTYKGYTTLTRAQFNALLESLDMDTDVNDIDYVDSFVSASPLVSIEEFRALLTKLDLDNGVQDTDYFTILS